jgi:hypothetical protein
MAADSDDEVNTKLQWEEEESDVRHLQRFGCCRRKTRQESLE